MKSDAVCKVLKSLIIICCLAGISALMADFSVRAAIGVVRKEAASPDSASKKEASPGNASYARPLSGQLGSTLSTPSESLKDDEKAVSGGEKEFREWFEEQKDGETFQLTDNIVWEGGIMTSSCELNIDMNGYGFIIPANVYMGISGTVTFKGSTGMPIFTVERGGGLLLNEGVILEVDNGCGILVNGNLVSGSQGDTFLGIDRTKIRVSGSEGVGIKAQGSILLEHADIELEDGACGLKAGRDAAGYLSWIRGDGMSIIAGETVVSDTSTFDPLPVKAEIIKRDIQLDLNTVRFVNRENFPGLLEERQLYILSSPGYPVRTELVEVDWDISEVDFTVPGTYQAVAWPHQLFDEASNLIFPTETVPIVVTDPNKIYLQDITRLGDKYYAVLYEKLPEDQELQLYFSADDGKNWDVWPVSGKVDNRRYLMEGRPDHDRDYLFQVEAVNGGEIRRSNILEIHIETDGTTNCTGNRDDSRRDEPEEEIKIPESQGALGEAEDTAVTAASGMKKEAGELAKETVGNDQVPLDRREVRETFGSVSVRNTAPDSNTETELQKEAAEEFKQNSSKTMNSETSNSEEEDLSAETEIEDVTQSEAGEERESISENRKQRSGYTAEVQMLLPLLLVGGISGLVYYRVQKNG